MRLTQSFFGRDSLTVAKALIGTKLVRRVGGQILSGMVVETEAYAGFNDSASHAFRGQTPRNSIMFGPAGFSYVYLIYGIHYMFNVVTEPAEVPGAVLFRAIEPLNGQAQMAAFRGKNGPVMTNGPGKLCQAMQIDKSLNKVDLMHHDELWLEPHRYITANHIAQGPRIGIGYAEPKDQQALRRFWLKGNHYISK